MQQGRSRTDNPLLDRFSRIVGYPYFALMHRIRWYGTENIPAVGPAIIAANHQSFYDPVLLSLAASRRIVYLALQQYFDYPVLGFLMRAYGAVAIEEDSPAPSAYARMLEALREGHVCGIFPEGGRSKDGLPCPPRPGVAALALRCGVPIIPATICGASRAWPPKQRLPRPASISILFHKPIPVDPDRHRLRNDRALRREIALKVMLKIADGFTELGEPDLARAARRKLLRWAGQM